MRYSPHGHTTAQKQYLVRVLFLFYIALSKPKYQTLDKLAYVRYTMDMKMSDASEDGIADSPSIGIEA